MTHERTFCIKAACFIVLRELQEVFIDLTVYFLALVNNEVAEMCKVAPSIIQTFHEGRLCLC